MGVVSKELGVNLIINYSLPISPSPHLPISPSPHLPNYLLPIPNPQFPIPNSQFPIPNEYISTEGKIAYRMAGGFLTVYVCCHVFTDRGTCFL